MGCTVSKLDDSEVVMRCNNRRRLVKEVVNFREDFAIAHIAYIHALKSFGHALRHFAAGDFASEQPSPGTPSTPVLPLPEASPPAAALPPPPPASELSSPPPPAASAPPPPPPPPKSPPTATSSLPPDIGSPRVEPSPSNSRVVTPTQSPTDSPPYSPQREETEEFFMSFPPPPPPISLNPPPPPSPPRNFAWDFFDLFHPPPIPFHLQEQRRIRQVEEEEDDPLDSGHVQEEEGIPDLEEEEQKEKPYEQVEPEDEYQELARTGEEPVLMAPEGAGEQTSEKGLSMDKQSISERTEEVVEKEEAVVAVKDVAVEILKKEPEITDKKELVVLTISKGKSLTEVVGHLDDQFIRAYDSGKDVSGMLETQRVNQHFSFLEFRDSAKVFNAITWHWSNKSSLALRDSSEESELAECGMTGSHAATLERLYAWEKKLYDEVKAGELIRIAFDRKCQQLRSQDAKGEDHNVIDKTRASIKSLDTRLIVALRAIHSVSIRIQKLTDEELYPQLAEVLQGLMKMWKVMLECHQTQHEIALEMKSLGNSAAEDEVSEAHIKATIELENELNRWQNCFSRWISSQKCYIDALLAWLRLCHMQPETDAIGRNVSPFWAEGSPIYSLIKHWNQALKRLEDKGEAVDTISNFATVVHSLQTEQMEELQQKRRAEGFAKDLDQKTLSIQNMEKKYMESSADDSDDKQDLSGVHSDVRIALQERRAALNTIRSRVEEEKEKHFKAVQDRRGTTLSSLQTNLPSIFDAMTSFAAAAVEEYEALQRESEKSKFHPDGICKLPQISEE